MALKINRTSPYKARILSTLVMIFALMVQPLVALNVPAVFATTTIDTIVNETFDSFTGANAPSNWAVSGTGNYASDGSCGTTANCVKFDHTAVGSATLTLPLAANQTAKALSFYLGQLNAGDDSDSEVSVEQFNGATSLGSTNYSSSASDVALNVDATKIVFSTPLSTGNNLAFDDVKVTATTTTNTAPVADSATISTPENTAVNGTLTATDADGDTLVFSKVADPAHGTVVVNLDGAFTYTPAASYVGADSFTFKVNDGTVDSTQATVNITINSAASSVITINTSEELRDAIANQADGQVWNIAAGNYAVTQNNTLTAGGQTGWYFPITADNLVINGAGAGSTTIYGTGYTANGAWHTQDFVAIFGDDVTLNGLTLMPKVEPNKTIEVLGNNVTIKNVTIEPNTLTDQTEYDSISDATWAQEAKQWGGSLYFNHAGNHTVQNVTIKNAGISYRYSPSGTNITLDNVTLDYSTDVDWINGYRYSSGFDNGGSTITGTPNVVYHVSSAPNNLDSVFSNIHDGDTVLLESNITVPAQITVDESITFDGQGHDISVSGTGYRLLLKGDGTTLTNMNVNKTDKTGVQNIVGVQANNVTIDNVDFTGQFNIGDSEVSRALEISGNNFTIKDSSFNHLRQPAYINGFTGAITGSHVANTKGWVITGDSNVTFSGNTWGADADANVVDIAVIDNDGNASTPATNNYPCSVMAQIRADNHNASIDNQLLTGSCDTAAPSVDSVVLNGKSVSIARDANCGPTEFNLIRGKVSLSATITDDSGVGSAKYKIRKVTDGGCTQAGIYNSGSVTMNNQSGDEWVTLAGSELDTNDVPADGNYTIQMTVKDTLGNTATKYIDITVDNTAPAQPQVLGFYKDNDTSQPIIPCGGITNSTKILIDWEDGESDVAYYWFGTKTNQHHKKVTVSEYKGAMTPGNNPYYYTVIAVDNAGNESAISDQCGLTLDQEAPDAFLVSPADNAVVDGSSITQEWGSHAGDVDYFIYESYHNASATSLRWRETIHATSKTAVNVADSTYWWRVKAVDHAGNESAWSDLWKITVDNDPLLTADYFTVHADQLGVGFSIDRFDDADKVEVALYDAGDHLITKNVGDSTDMRNLLNNHTGQMSSPFYIPSQPNDSYWTFGTPDWANVAVPAYAVVTVFYGSGEEISKQVDFVPTNADIPTQTYAALIENLPKETTAKEDKQEAQSIIPQLFSPSFFGNTPIQPFSQGNFPINTPADDQGEANTPEEDDTDESAILGEQDKESGTPLEDTDVLGVMDSTFLGLAWYWWLIIVAALIGGWLLIAAAIRKGRENEA